MGRLAHRLSRFVDAAQKLVRDVLGKSKRPPPTHMAGAASNPRESWRPNAVGTPTRTLVEALAIAMNAGAPLEAITAVTPQIATCSADGNEFRFVLAPAAQFDTDTYASYYDLDTEADLDRVDVTLVDLQTSGGRFCIYISDEMLTNDEQSIAVVAHEVHELCALEAAFFGNGGRMTLRMLNSLIHKVYGTLHCAAWDHADKLVRNHRG